MAVRFFYALFGLSAEDNPFVEADRVVTGRFIDE